MENLKDLIALAAEGDAVEFQEKLSNELSNRTVAAIENLKPEVAAGIFGESYEPNLDLQESMEKMSLGHLAAKHFNHTGNHMYGDQIGHSDSAIAKHKKAADIIHAHVAKKYGKSTADAMKKNSKHSNHYDNESELASSDQLKHHHSFVKDHLGGHGSEEHKKYKSKVYGGESDFDHHANMKEEVDQIDEVERPKSPSDKVAMNVAVDIKDHPVATDAQFKAKNEKDKSKPASYHAGEDEIANIAAKTVGIPSKKD